MSRAPKRDRRDPNDHDTDKERDKRPEKSGDSCEERNWNPTQPRAEEKAIVRDGVSPAHPCACSIYKRAAVAAEEKQPRQP